MVYLLVYVVDENHFDFHVVTADNKEEAENLHYKKYPHNSISEIYERICIFD